MAGLSKLRAPGSAGPALRVLGLPSGETIVRTLGLWELGIGGWCAVEPSRPAAVAISIVYAVFAGVAAVLARRRVSCGCFGEDESPVSAAQAFISATVSLVALGAALAGPRGLTWVLGRPAGQAAVLLVAAAASTCAAVLAYAEFPRAWGAWSAQ